MEALSPLGSDQSHLVDVCLSIAPVALFQIKAPKGSTPTPNKVEQADRPVPKFVTEERDSKLYIHIKDPNDSERLVKIKQIALDNPGMSELILVFGESEKTALRMPFKVSINQEVVDLFKEGYEPETVILK